MLELSKMSQSDFAEYYIEAVKKIAIEYTTSGYIKAENADNYAKSVIDQYLPKGMETEGHYLFNIVNAGEIVGILWYGKTSEAEAFIYDLNIKEAYQGKGYGKKTMLLLEKHAKGIGVNKITLHVFGHNKRAINLYEKLGYTAFSLHMAKNI